MTMVVRLFAAAREVAKTDEIALALGADDPATADGDGSTVTVAWIKEQIVARHPELSPIVRISRFAVNEAYVADDARVRPSDRIACIPPVSGG